MALPETWVRTVSGADRGVDTRVVGLSLNGRTVILESRTGQLSFMPRGFLIPSEELALRTFERLRELL